METQQAVFDKKVDRVKAMHLHLHKEKVQSQAEKERQIKIQQMLSKLSTEDYTELENQVLKGRALFQDV